MIQIGAFGRVTVLPDFWALSPAERIAVVAHEAGHRWHKHIRQQWIFNWVLSAEAMRRLRHAQEFEADTFARLFGYGPQLAAALARQPHEATRTHPSTRERVLRLLCPV